MKKYQTVCLLFFCLSISPLLYLSLNTPFALIDDYSDWLFIKMSFSQLLHDQFYGFFSLNTDRTRPLFAVTEFLTFSLFGNNPWLHHLFRWAIKGFAFIFCWRAICEILPTFLSHEEFTKNKFVIFFVMLVVWFFFPNNPDARLAPQELSLTFFLALLIWVTLKILTTGDLSRVKKSTIYLLYISILGLTFSKETGFAFAITAVVFLVGLNLLQPKNKMSNWATLLPVIIFLGWAVFSILWKLKNGGTPYGHSGMDAIGANINDLFKLTLLYKLNYVLPLILWGPIIWLLFVNFRSFNRGTAYSLKDFVSNKKYFILSFLFCELATAMMMALLSPYSCVRYIFPFLAPFVIILGICVTLFLQAYKRQAFQIAILLISFYFLLSVYGLTAIQYGVQFSARNAENSFLEAAVSTAKLNGGSISIQSSDMEFSANVINYINQFRPYFYDDASVLASNDEGLEKVSAYRLISDAPKNPGILLSEHPYVESDIIIFARKLSHLFGSTEYRYLDCGATNDSQWLIYKQND